MKKLIVLLLTLCLLAGCSRTEPQASPSPEPTAAPEVSPQPTAAPTGTQEPSPAPAPSQSQEPLEPEPEYLLEARAVNEDVVGWIKVPNTVIDYPIVLGEDNDYYLDHNLEKENSKSGCIFLDYRNAQEDQRRHLIVWGHNMRNGTMFHDLSSYKNRDFFENTPSFELWLFGRRYECEVMSQYILTTDLNFIKTKFTSDEGFLNYFRELRQMAKHDNGLEITAQDQVISLITCTYEYEDSRNVVQGLVRPAK